MRRVEAELRLRRLLGPHQPVQTFTVGLDTRVAEAEQLLSAAPGLLVCGHGGMGKSEVAKA